MSKFWFLTTTLVLGFSHNGLSNAAEQHSERGFYAGIFGGSATIDTSSVTQSTTIYNRAGTGGSQQTYDLSVESQGNIKNDTTGLGGIHAGYEFSEVPFGQSGWGVKPAVEVEGYYIRTTGQEGYLTNPQVEPAVGNSAYNLPAGTHTFKESFDLDIGVMLLNGILSFKTPWSDSIFPYVGGGVGANISARRKVVSTQLTPVYEPTFNHFNGDDNGSRSGFATQGKAGVRAKIMDHLSLFAEYRYLYSSESNYVFGPTFYPVEHPRTLDWTNHFSSVNVHSGVLGLEYGF